MKKSDNYSFHLNKIESENYKLFCEEHKRCMQNTAIGGEISIIFTPTGIGTGISVKCDVCGEEKNITDYDSW